jgi:S1-C subfamily serine protease
MIQKFTALIGLIALASAFVGCGGSTVPPVVYHPPARPTVVPYVAVQPKVDVLAASCRVLVENSNVKYFGGQKGIETFSDCGSGTLVGPGRVITNWHVVKDRKPNSVLAVEFNGSRYPYTVLREDKEADLAVLEVPVIVTNGVVVQPVDVDPFGIGLYKPTTTIIGFGPGDIRVAVGNYVKTWKGDKYEFYSLDVANRNGDSGGGVFNSVGVFVAAQWGCSKEGETFCTGGEPLRRILEEPR